LQKGEKENIRAHFLPQTIKAEGENMSRKLSYRLARFQLEEKEKEGKSACSRVNV